MAGTGTPAVAAAEKAGIAFALHEYSHDPGVPSYGLEAAEKLALDPARVFKTLGGLDVGGKGRVGEHDDEEADRHGARLTDDPE